MTYINNVVKFTHHYILCSNTSYIVTTHGQANTEIATDNVIITDTDKNVDYYYSIRYSTAFVYIQSHYSLIQKYNIQAQNRARYF